jgi:tyrosine aminotransferase
MKQQDIFIYFFQNKVRSGLTKLSQVILGANSLVQSIIPEALLKTPQSYYQKINQQLAENASILCDTLAKIKGFHVVRPAGAMYMMVSLTNEATIFLSFFFF